MIRLKFEEEMKACGRLRSTLSLMVTNDIHSRFLLPTVAAVSNRATTTFEFARCEGRERQVHQALTLVDQISYQFSIYTIFSRLLKLES